VSVKANWHTEVDVPPLTDPFANFVEQPVIPVAVEDVGKPIDLSSSQPQLRRRLIELVRTESQLYNRGVRCEIRERDDTSCCSCPMRGRIERVEALCDVGCEQEQVLTTLAIHGLRDRKAT
jgi:hypothetical protein